jgi:hypothetical protein
MAKIGAELALLDGGDSVDLFVSVWASRGKYGLNLVNCR